MQRVRNYPRLRSTVRRNEGAAAQECAACASPATHLVRVQNGQLTTADTDHHACGRHESIARADVERFLQHVRTKERFLADPDALKDEVRRRREHER